MAKQSSGLAVYALVVSTGVAFTPSEATAATHWVDDDGSASWADCEGAAPLDGADACALATANSNAVAGDEVVLRGGTYNTQLAPTSSGTADAVIVYRAHVGETPVLTDVGNVAAIFLNGRDYIRIDGITVEGVYRLATVTGGSDYNEILNCTLSDASTTGNGGLGIYSNGVTPATANTHNWIHHNTIFGASHITSAPSCNDQSNLMKVGSGNEDGLSNYNTVENNTLYWGGHHVLQVASQYNVIRNNVMHNEGHITAPAGCESGYCPDPETNMYGNRVLIVENYGSDDYLDPTETESYVVVEGNRLGHAGLPSDDNGADVLTIGASNTIARYNDVFAGRSTGVYFRSSANPADDIHFYNNSVFGNGIDTPCRDQWPAWIEKGVRIQNGSDGNALKNNIVVQSMMEDIDCQGACTSVIEANWLSADGDPGFADPDVSDPMSESLPDFSLLRDSAVIDAGAPLTLVAAADTGDGDTLVVDDAWFFQDGRSGSALSDVRPDWIAVGTVDNVVQIASIDYGTGTMTLENPISRAAGDAVWLYRNSSGQSVLGGSAPDLGAHEHAPNDGDDGDTGGDDTGGGDDDTGGDDTGGVDGGNDTRGPADTGDRATDWNDHDPDADPPDSESSAEGELDPDTGPLPGCGCNAPRRAPPFALLILVLAVVGRAPRTFRR